ERRFMREWSASDMAGEEGELLLFDFALHDDGGADEDEEDLLVLGDRLVGEEAFEEGDFGEDGGSDFAFGLAGDGLAAEQQGAAVGNADGGFDFGDLEFGFLDRAGGGGLG